MRKPIKIVLTWKAKQGAKAIKTAPACLDTEEKEKDQRVHTTIFDREDSSAGPSGRLAPPSKPSLWATVRLTSYCLAYEPLLMRFLLVPKDRTVMQSASPFFPTKSLHVKSSNGYATAILLETSRTMQSIQWEGASQVQCVL
jgi:hypothetical protein